MTALRDALAHLEATGKGLSADVSPGKHAGAEHRFCNRWSMFPGETSHDPARREAVSEQFELFLPYLADFRCATSAK
jgi:hypothetical protein